MAELNKKIGFIGGGNMGEAIIGALIQSETFSSSMIYVTDISKERLDLMNKTYGINIADNNFNLFTECDIVVLAVKPQQMDQILSEIAGQAGYGISDRKLVISIAAGVTIKRIENILYSPLDDDSRKKLPVIRVMPNTPALVLAGMSGMSPNSCTVSDDIKTAKTILHAIGKVAEFEEDELDAVTGLSGSGPAYVFYLAESMIEAGINVGLNPDDAVTLAITTLEGAVKLMSESNDSPEELRRKVTSPGGTTEAAFKVLEGNNVKQIIIDAIAAATNRSKEVRSEK
ncbi:MAG: pyrroline-5-carboxylate reductase [Desulfobacteraceae bacterium]|nr:pyrroline-5-carboxylate reductase [Desulfobacteraceae bacterium]